MANIVKIPIGNVATGADSVNLVTKSEATDWRMQGPVSGRLVPSFKPGTSTWNTDSLKEAQKIKRATDAVEQQGSRKQSSNMQQQPRNATLDPSKWWAMEYNPRYEESVQTVGHAARSFTSTTAAVTTKNELVRQLKHRCVDPARTSVNFLVFWLFRQISGWSWNGLLSHSHQRIPIGTKVKVCGAGVRLKKHM